MKTNNKPLELQQFPENMDKILLNKKNLKRCLLSGLYEEHLQVNGVQRTFITYLTEGLEYNQRSIVLAPPSNTNVMLYLELSGWKAFADKHKIFLHILVPLNQVWNYDGSDADYMNTVYAKIQSRDYYVVMQDNIYAFGIGDGATVAHQAAMKMTSEWSGLATIGNLDSAAMMNAAVTIESQDQQGVELMVQASKAQLPVWMLWDKAYDEDKKVLNYWKVQNRSVEPPLYGAGADEIYLPSTIKKKSEINEEIISQVRVTNGVPLEKADGKLLDTIWEYIGAARRHRGFNGKFLRYFKDPIEYGATCHNIEVDGFTRVWYEYIPDKIKRSGAPAPLIVCMHGRGGSAETFFDISGMSVVAEERDFIAVFPQAGVYQQKPGGIRNVLLWSGKYFNDEIDDVKFIRLMVENIQSRIAVDKGRVYACGQSSGGMMTSKLGQKASDIFTAVSPWSGLRDVEGMLPLPERITPSTPYLFLFGETDFLCADKNGSELPYKVQKLIADFLKCIINLYKLSHEPLSYRCGEIIYYIYRNNKGTPMLIVGRVSDMAHANYPRQSWIAYDQFFAKFSREKDGTLLYMGQPAE